MVFSDIIGAMLGILYDFPIVVESGNERKVYQDILVSHDTAARVPTGPLQYVGVFDTPSQTISDELSPIGL